MKALGLMALVLLSLAGCTKTCTEIGCFDQFFVRVANEDGSYTPGTHVLEVTADGVLLSCTFPLPPDTVGGGGIASPVCSPGLDVFAGPLANCTTSSNATTVSQTCTPIEGTIQEQITVNGTPATVRLRQTVDGSVVFDRTITPTYKSSRPNGPGCEPLVTPSAGWCSIQSTTCEALQRRRPPTGSSLSP
jgi:hypothetical protein